VFEHYGTTETGLGGGVDCAAHAGYHLREADLLFEVVDATTGAPLPRGGFGEVVFTTLTRRGMPFIRYRTGDLSRFVPKPCGCGSVLELLERVRRRNDDGVALGDREEISMAELDDALLGIAGLSDFSAAIGRGQPAVLAVRACAVRRDEREVEREVRDALMALPAIRRSISSRALDLALGVTGELIAVSGGKRRIDGRPAPEMARRAGESGTGTGTGTRSSFGQRSDP
jgi:phenylacetate-coenzyme A ligase PaaK-like adenylate-forming protein